MFRTSLIPLKFCCTFHNSCKYNGQAGRAMNKFMSPSKKKKYHYNDGPTLPTPNVFGKTSFESQVTGSSRRSSVLNKLFMRHITDLMATGEYSSQIVGYGIEVNKVKVTPDYKFLKVYWIAKSSEDNEAIENVLKKNAGFLRNELSQLRVMGKVPNIVFVKDKGYSEIMEVESRLAKADFGDDHIESDFADKLKSELYLWTSLEGDIKKTLEMVELNFVDDLEDDLASLPLMPQNVLGLNHADILQRVKKGMKASEAVHRNSSNSDDTWSQFKMTQPINEDPLQFASHGDQRDAFRKFLHKRQILQWKRRRMDKTWSPDKECITEELRERHVYSLDSQDNEQDDEDYILEDTEEMYKE